MNKLLTTILAYCMLIFSINAQSIERSVISSSGISNVQSGASLEWTLGELATETFFGQSVILTQGFQQSRVWFTSVEEIQPLEIFVYPNPVNNVLVIEQPSAKTLQVELFNLTGKKLLNLKTEKRQHEIDLHFLPSSAYTLIVSDPDLFTQSIIKLIKL